MITATSARALPTEPTAKESKCGACGVVVTGHTRRHHRSPIDFAAIAREAIPALPAMLARLLPDGRVIGREFVALNPRRSDRRPGSFKVRVAGARAGAWSDFATGDKGGDIISLVAYVENVRQDQAALLVARMLGINIERPHHG